MNQYKATYNKIKHLTKSEFSTEYWNKKCQLISKEFCKNLSKDFLQNHHIKETMVAANEMKAMQQLGHVKNFFKGGEKLDSVLREFDRGGLVKHKSLEGKSCNIINHAYFAQKLLKHSNTNPKGRTILEIGGGFGTLGHILRKTQKCTYIIVDVPAIIALQKSYLEDNGNICLENKDIDPSKVNLVPIGLIDKMDLNPDIFIAMWSIGEVAPAMNDFIIDNKNIFNASSFMVGTHNWKCGSFTQASRVYQYFSAKASYTEEVGPSNHLMIK